MQRVFVKWAWVIATSRSTPRHADHAGLWNASTLRVHQAEPTPRHVPIVGVGSRRSPYFIAVEGWLQ